jgi:hypothetical protein
VFEGQGAGRYELHTHYLSLPYLFGATPTHLPRPPYLSPDPRRVQQWRWQLRQYKGAKIGVVWRCGPDSWTSTQRSCQLWHLLPLTDIRDMHLFALQQDVSDQERATSGQMGIVDLSGELKTWDDTAAVMSSLDAVVSVDSGPAHVSGALNVPTWALLPAAADWRWGLDVTTPWYPSMQLFRRL